MSKGPARKPNAKRKLIIVRLQDVELNAVKDYASKQGKPISTMVRDLLLSHLEAEGVPTSIVMDNPNQLKIDTN
jgi:predicted DNA binding CopG/RHH family protein